MSEQLKQAHGEKFNDTGLESEGSERSKQLAHERERNAAEKERASKETELSARHEVERVVAEQEKRDEKNTISPAEKRRDAPMKNSKAARDAVFKKEMSRVQNELSAPSRAFSKMIHNNVVEKTSEVVGATIARPNAILYGSLFAFILTAAVYFWARHYGHALSGFETIAAFIVGWLAGIIVDYIRILITGGRT